MGFKVPKKTAVITFDGTDYDGAEVHVRFGISFKQYLDLQRVFDSKDNADAVGLLKEFGDKYITEWNLEDEDGSAIPVSGEALISQPIEFGQLIFTKWLEAVAGPSTPFGQPSPDGSTSAAATTQTETE